MASSLLIVVPVHEEDGWLCNSPGESAKSRLESKSSVKSPEEIRSACAKADEKAQALRDLHLDAVKRRAQRDIERVAEAERRRLRSEAAEKQKILEKAAQHDKKAMACKEALEAEAAEKRARREALREAFFAARSDMAAAAHQRENQLAERLERSAAKRNKLLQATVHKANYEVKHALAVATAAKEKERAAAAQASASLDERMAAATFRRVELLEARRDVEGSSASSPPKSPGKESAKKSSRARARQVALVLNDEAVALEIKRKTLADAMDKAFRARGARLEATVRRAAAYKDKAARAKAAVEAREARGDELAHQIAEKGNAAEVRRLLRLKATVLKKGANPSAVAIILSESRRAAPAPALAARLSLKPTLLASELAARLQGATARRDRVLFEMMTRLSTATGRAAAAAGRRAARLEALRVNSAASATKALQAAADATAKRAATAHKFNARVAAASANRSAALEQVRGLLLNKARAREVAAARRTALLPGAARAARVAAVVSRRAAFDKAAVDRGEALTARLERAAERRAAKLASRVARANASVTLRTAAVRLRASVDGNVLVRVVAPGEKAVAEKAAKMAAADVAVPQEMKEAPQEVEAGRGFFGRLVGRLFGY